jgi:hypothetical protein
MSLFFGDIRIRTAIELGLEDIQKNPWLLDDILGDTLSNQYLRERYGSQIESCKQWFANNRVYTFMSNRDDKMEFPCVVIQIGNSNEKADMKHMGDLSVEKVRLMPNNINKQIPYIIKPIPGSYNPTSGAFTFSSTIDFTNISPGMLLVDPATGTGYSIQSIGLNNSINLFKGLSLTAAKYGVLSEFQFYETRISHTFMKENYKITCNAMDQQTLLWLHAITTYSLLRYRQALLEKDGYAESLISSGQMYPNPDYSDAGQVIWSRDIEITGQVENRWYNQPHRLLETAVLGQGGTSTTKPDGTPVSEGEGYIGGLKIISNITDTFEDLNTVNWSTLADIAYKDEE